MRVGRVAFLVLVCGAASLACREREPLDAEPLDEDRPARAQWIADQTKAHSWWVRSFLNGTRDMQFYDGFYPIEFDPTTGGAWRWMDKKGIVRLRTSIDGTGRVHD